MALIRSEKEQAVIKRDNGNGEEIEVSCYLTQGHELTSTMTTNPVEAGIDITDHVKQEPRKITLRGITTDDPLSFTATIDSFKTLINPVNGLPSYPSRDTFQAFKKIHDSKERVLISTAYEVYSNMLLTSFTTEENKENGSSIDFTATFTELRIVQTATGTGINLANQLAAERARAESIAARADEEKKLSKKAKNAAKQEVLESTASKFTGLGVTL